MCKSKSNARFVLLWLLAVGYWQKLQAESIEQCAINQKPIANGQQSK